MNEGIIAVFIPIIAIIVTGLVIVTAIYFKAREKQMLIEKGLTPDQIKEFFERKNRDRFTMLKIGIVAIALGLGIGLGMMLEEATNGEYWPVLTIFTFTGAGFIAANLIGRKLEKSERELVYKD